MNLTKQYDPTTIMETGLTTEQRDEIASTIGTGKLTGANLKIYNTSSTIDGYKPEQAETRIQYAEINALHVFVCLVWCKEKDAGVAILKEIRRAGDEVEPVGEWVWLTKP